MSDIKSTDELRAWLRMCGAGADYLVPPWRLADISAMVERLAAERDALCDALTKINVVCDSIIGAQGFNWSEHAYRLVAALNAAGFRGADYKISKENLGTLLEQLGAAEAERDALKAQLDAIDRLQTPRAVFDAAEQLLTAIGVSTWSLRKAITHRDSHSLADAYERLRNSLGRY